MGRMDLLDDAPGNTPEFSVSELSGAVKKTIEGAFGHVRVRGEVGRVSRPRSGHLYLDLKDDRAVLAAVCWKGVAARLEVQPEEGMEVVAEGRLTTFPGQSRYQLVIESVAPAGVGALMALLEKRKAALAAEGLFAAERKRPIPYLPRRIGVVTSPSGAVIRDILHRLAERFPVEVLLWPVAVQGRACAPEVAAAIRGFNALPPGIPRPDVLIVARGGGSVEDLWGFNEEIVARAASESAIPLISAVGHETDTTLIDHVADVRAPTPTAAAELATPVRGELLANLSALEERRVRAMARLMEDRRRRLRDLLRAAPRPADALAERRQRLDYASERLPRALARAADARRLELTRAAGRLSPALVLDRLGRRGDRLAALAARARPAALGRIDRRRDALRAAGARFARLPDRLRRRIADETAEAEARARRLGRAGEGAVATARERVSAARRLLESLSYKGVLARGFAVVRDGEGAVITTAAAAAASPALEIEFADGRHEARAAGPRPRRRRDEPPPGAQGALDL